MAVHHAPHSHSKRSSKSHANPYPGKGGSRGGYQSSNEIEDMGIFDGEPEKAPSKDHRHSAKSIDDNGYRERK
jgi:hypothetical protein